MNKRQVLAQSFVYRLVQFCGVIVAGYHTFQVNSLVNPFWIALLSAVAVDGLLIFAMEGIRFWGGDRRVAAVVGVAMFFVVSAACQTISYQIEQGLVINETLRFIATYVIPIASGTGSVTIISLMFLFDQNRNGVPDFMERKPKPSQYTPAPLDPQAALSAKVRQIQPQNGSQQPAHSNARQFPNDISGSGVLVPRDPTQRGNESR